MQNALSLTRKYASSNANVLLEGESGVGKEIIANLIHLLSSRADKPMIKVNCSAIPEHLFESELFGHKRGAFTGALIDKPGKFQLADGGTLFLDEIGELPLNQQAKLLRAIEDFEISPVGSTEPERVDVRIISATNKNLDSLIKTGRFRSDLRFRLNILSLYIPPLRDRREDIPILSAYFLSEIANNEGRITKQMDKECLEYLSSLDYPGNVRELKSLIYKAYLLTDDSIIRKSDILNIRAGAKEENRPVFNQSFTLSELETQYIQYQLEKNNYCLTDTAHVLGVEVSNLSRKLKNMGISVKELKKNHLFSPGNGNREELFNS
jgi:transcriptional regulator with PAS, ATPase and Fis domain